MSLEPGARLGPYEIDSAIGVGAMGEVYRARHTKLGRDIAIKVLPARVAGPERLRRFEQEARLASSLNHPNIVTIYDIGHVDDVHYIAMELVEGQTLRAMLRAGALPMKQAIDVAAQIADGLAKAHAARIVHRDLKPENVMVTKDGLVKILDFGLGKPPAPFIDDQSGVGTITIASASTTPGTVLGTVQYMSPEQAVGREVDFRSDQFALGLVLYEMVTGRVTFRRASAVQTMTAIITEEPPRVADLSPHVPSRVEEIIERCLAKAPGERYDSTLDLARDLKSAAGVGAPHPLIQAGRRARYAFRRRAAVASAAAIVATAIAGWQWWPRSERATGQIPTVAVLPLANLSGNPLNDYLGIGVAETLISDLAALPTVTVVSRTLSNSAGAKERDLARIARDLGVSFVVDGGVQEADRRLKLTVRLVRPDASVAWAGSYEGSSADLFAIQKQLAQGVTGALELRLTQADRQKLERQPAANVEAFADYAQGRALLERLDVPGNLDRAVALFSAAAAKDRNFALAHAGLGEAYWARYQQTKDANWTIQARAATLDALRLDPNQAAVRHSLAVIYRGTGDTDRAVEELRHELDLRPNSDAAHQMLGEILTDTGQIDAAEREFQQAIALRPNFWGNYDALGLALYRIGRFREAAAAFERVTELQPDNANGFQRLGTAYNAAGDTPRAIVNYERALTLAPTPKAYANLGFVYYSQHRFADAANAYNRALALDPTSHITYRNLGDVYQRQGRRDDARTAYGKAIEFAERMLQVNPKDAVTLSQQALYEAKLAERGKAERHMNAAVALAPADGRVLYNLAVVQALGEHKEAALNALGQALAHGASASVAREDDDLQLIRGTAEFERMVTRKY